MSRFRSHSRASTLPLVSIALTIAQHTLVGQDTARYSARQALDDRLVVIERQVLPAAEAMPERLYGYAPTGGAFAGVRTFAEQLKHLAASNWQIGAKVLGERPPAGTANEAAPSSIQTKAQILEYARGSFACLHRAIATVDETNLVTPIGDLTGTWERTRLGLIIDALAHSSDHYGQIVEYLRANGIVPPATGVGPLRPFGIGEPLCSTAGAPRAILATRADLLAEDVPMLDTALQERLASLVEPVDFSTEREVQRLVWDFVDDRRADGWPPERVIIAVKQIALDAGLKPTMSEDFFVAMIGWCIHRYFHPD